MKRRKFILLSLPCLWGLNSIFCLPDLCLATPSILMTWTSLHSKYLPPPAPSPWPIHTPPGHSSSWPAHLISDITHSPIWSLSPAQSDKRKGWGRGGEERGWGKRGWGWNQAKKWLSFILDFCDCVPSTHREKEHIVLEWQVSLVCRTHNFLCCWPLDTARGTGCLVELSLYTYNFIFSLPQICQVF